MNQKKLVSLLLLWVANTLLLVVVAAVFPRDVVLGNISITKPLASILNGFILTVVIYFVPTIAKKLDLKISNEKANLVSYFLADLLIIWILKRLADTTGLGVSSVLFVIILAVLAAIVQFKVNHYGSKIFK